MSKAKAFFTLQKYAEWMATDEGKAETGVDKKSSKWLVAQLKSCEPKKGGPPVITIEGFK